MDEAAVAALGFQQDTVARIMHVRIEGEAALKSDNVRERFLGEWLVFYMDAYLEAMQAWKGSIDKVAAS